MDTPNIITIIREHTLYERLLTDMMVISITKEKTFTPEYPFEEAHAVIGKIIEYKEKARKYDELMASQKLSS